MAKTGNQGLAAYAVQERGKQGIAQSPRESPQVVQRRAAEGEAMRRRAIAIQQEQQRQAPPVQQQNQVPQFAPKPPIPGMGGMQRPNPAMPFPSGINFGPGRANRVPEPGSPEYINNLNRVTKQVRSARGLGR